MHGERKGELLVVMRMESHRYGRIKRRIERADDAGEILLEHRAERIDNGNRHGTAGIDALCEILEIRLAVRKRVGRLQEDAVSLFAHALCDRNALSMLAVREDDAHRIDGLAIARRKIVHIIAIPIDHCDVLDAVLTIHHVGCGILRQMVVSAAFLMSGVLEPAHLDDVCTRLLQLLDDALDGAGSKTRSIDICAIAQRAVQQCNLLFHRSASSAKDQNPCVPYCHSPRSVSFSATQTFAAG